MGRRVTPEKPADPKPIERPYFSLTGDALAAQMAGFPAKTEEERKELLREVYYRYADLVEKRAKKIKMSDPANSFEDVCQSIFAEKLFCPDWWGKFLRAKKEAEKKGKELALAAYMNVTIENYLLSLRRKEKKDNEVLPLRLDDEVS